MDKRILWALIAIIIVVLVAVFYPRRVDEPAPVALPPSPETSSEFTAIEPPEPEPTPEFVAEESPEPLPPLPELDQSDEPAAEALAKAAGPELVANHLVSDAIVRKLVVTVDNLTGDALWIKSRAVPPVDGRFVAEGPESAPVISAENYERYDALFRLVGEVDAAALAASYQRYYPLLQQAYEQLGYPGRQFHNRALEVIDHLLATPVVEGPIRLEQPHVMYKYADPALEALSAGQKIMLRIGPENAAIARSKLIELRSAIRELSATPAAP